MEVNVANYAISFLGLSGIESVDGTEDGDTTDSTVSLDLEISPVCLK